MNVRDQGFDLTSAERGGKRQTCAIFRCARCEAELPIFVRPGGTAHPDLFANQARGKGWSINLRRKSDVFCPECSSPRRRDIRPQATADTEPKSIEGTPRMAAAPNPTATSDQRVKIRNLLDKHFDDSTGMYLDGMTDALIAEMAGVPRVIVERVRDTAYGPIKVDPIVSGFRNEIALVKREIESLSEAVESLKRKAADFEQRLDGHLRKVA